MNQVFETGRGTALGTSETGLQRSELFAAENKRIREAYARRGESENYSLFSPAQLLAIQERERQFLGLLRSYGWGSVEHAKILEMGCGTGLWLCEFVKWGARPENVFGIELLPERVAAARRVCAAGVTVKCQSAADPEFAEESFDLILQSTLFTSILDEALRRRIAREMLRLVRPSGLIVWYDFHVNNPANPDVRRIKKKEIRALFPDCRIYLKRITLAPPIGRRIARISYSLYSALSASKVLNTHYLGIIRKG